MLWSPRVWPGRPVLHRVGASSVADPSRSPRFHAGLLRFPPHAGARHRGRVEVVFHPASTGNRSGWPSAFPIARGWERQTDLRVNAVLYHPRRLGSYRPLAGRQRGVCSSRGRGCSIDFGGQGRGRRCCARPPPVSPRRYGTTRTGRCGGSAIRTRWSTDRHASSMSARPCFIPNFRRAGSATVRIRGSGMWAATRGEGCVSRNAAGWLTVVAAAPGPITVRVSQPCRARWRRPLQLTLL